MIEEAITDIKLPFPKFGTGRNKVREMFDVGEIVPGALMAWTSDRFSAFNVVMRSGIPGRGKLLNFETAYWKRLLENEGVITTDLIQADFADFPSALRTKLADCEPFLDGRVSLVTRGKPVKCEGMPRNYLFGSAYEAYAATGEVYGIKLPKGLKKGDRLPEPIFTASTKAPFGEDDRNVNFEELKEIVGVYLAERVRNKSMAIDRIMQKDARKRGFQIADQKLEFVWLAGGYVGLGDEVGTGDSSRFVDLDGNVLDRDKQWFRDWLMSIEFDKKTPMYIPSDVAETVLQEYIEGCRMITGSVPHL